MDIRSRSSIQKKMWVISLFHGIQLINWKWGIFCSNESLIIYLIKLYIILMLGIKIIISMIYRYITLCWHYRDLWYVISKIYAQRLVKHNVWKVNFSKNKAILKRQIKPLWKKYKTNHGMFHNLFDPKLWKGNNKKIRLLI